MRFCIFIAAVSLFITCRKPPSIVYDPYFEYDEVEHLNTKKDHDWMSKLEDKQTLTLDEERIRSLLSHPFDQQLSDTVFFVGADRIGFSRTTVPRNKFSALDSIFTEKHYYNFTGEIVGHASECLPVYRDILLFKKQNKTIGFGRVCFSCGQAIIVGTNKDTHEFGWSGDYARLDSLLK